MLSKRGVGKPADVYGIGAVLYELLSFLHPYYNENIRTMYQNIAPAKLKIPNFLSRDCKAIICVKK